MGTLSMKEQIFKSEIVGLLRVIGRELPELAYDLAGSEDFASPRKQSAIRIKLLTIQNYINDVLTHGDD
jgi:hypothetical protein